MVYVFPVRVIDAMQIVDPVNQIIIHPIAGCILLELQSVMFFYTQM